MPSVTESSKLSAEVFVIPLEDGKFIIYAPVRRAAFIGNRAAVNLLADLKDGSFDRSADPAGLLMEFLRRLEIVDAEPESLPKTTYAGDPDPTAVTLFLTTACDTATKVMSLETARRGIDFILGNAIRKGASQIEIAFDGGEPRVYWPVMTGSLDYAREQAGAVGITVMASTATSGILTGDQAAWMIANLEGASLSWNGLPESHDKHQTTPSGKGASDAVIHTIQRFDTAQFPYGIRVTVTADQISSMADSVEFICRHFKPQRIQVEPAYQMGRWHNVLSAESVDFIEQFRKAHGMAARYGFEISFSAARLGGLTNRFFGVTQDTFALSPNGNVSECDEVIAAENVPGKEVLLWRVSEG